MAKSGIAAVEKRKRGRPKLDEAHIIDDELLAFALNEFVEHGYGHASMSGIIAAAGISKTTLYSRYPSKEELFRAVIRRQMDQMSAALALESNRANHNLREGLEAYANRALEFSLKGNELAVNRLMYSESYRFPELGVTAWERAQVGVKTIAAFMRQCAKAERIQLKDVDAAAENYVLLLRGWYLNILLTDKKVTAQQRKAWVRSAVRTILLPWQKW